MKARAAFLSMVVGLVIAAVFVAPASSRRVPKNPIGPSPFGSCYTTNAFAVDPGNFTVSASGYGTNEVEIANTGTSFDGSPTAVIKYSFTGKVTGNNGTPFVPNAGNMSGTLSFTMGFPYSHYATTEFRPSCLAELQTDPGVGTGSYEAEIEGTVKNFPGVPDQPAILSLHSEYDNGFLVFAAGIELGTTCHELPHYPGETEVGGNIGGDGIGLFSGSLSTPPGQTSGRMALPTGPCDGSVDDG